MKTTAKTTATRRRRSPRIKRPTLLDNCSSSSISSSSSRGMLSFLTRLSGRRRRWRHVRSRSPTSSARPGATAAGGSAAAHCSPTCRQTTQPQASSSSSSSSMAEVADEHTTTSCCARCRAHASCSCELLGLHDAQTPLQQALDAHCRQRRYRSSPREQSCCSSRHRATASSSSTSKMLLRRRPPERASASGRSPISRTSYLAATLLILCTGLISYSEACSSRSTPKPRPPTPTPRPNITFHMYTCPPDYAEWYCLNGATCFTVKIVDSLLYNCLCANGYIGQRCEFKDLDGSYLPSRQRIMLETASIAGAVTIAVFLAVITFISVYIHCKRKQKELRMMSSNGTGVDVVDGPPRDPELRPFCSRSRSLMIFMAKNPNSSTSTPPIEQTRMPNWNYPPGCAAEASTRLASVNESKRPSQ